MKNKKLKIALAIIFAVLGLAYLVLYILFKEQVTFYTECVIDFINKPLPIVGVSLLVIMIFLWKVLVTSKFGQKKINELKEAIDKEKSEKEELKEYVDNLLKVMDEKVDMVKDQVIKTQEITYKICDLSHNIKIRGLTHEEAIDSNAEEE